MRAISVESTGEPDVLTIVEAEVPVAGANQLLVEVEAAGVNFIDIYFRRGTYPMPLPFTPGGEGVGIVRALGEGVTGFAVGDRAAWTGGRGAYAQFAAVPAASAAVLPAELPTEAGFVIAQGLTAHFLAHDIIETGPGTNALVHAAAGGVGLLLTQMLKLRGVRVIGIVSSEAKRKVALRAGADEVLVNTDGDFAASVRELTDGAGVEIVYDSVGAPTIAGSLASTRRRGTLVLFGASGGNVDSVSPAALAGAGSVTFIRPAQPDFIATREVFESRLNQMFDWIAKGDLVVDIGGRFPLERAAEAHRALESRASTGKLILVANEGLSR